MAVVVGKYFLFGLTFDNVIGFCRNLCFKFVNVIFCLKIYLHRFKFKFYFKDIQLHCSL